MGRNNGVSLWLTLLIVASAGCATGWRARGGSLTAPQVTGYLGEVSRLAPEAVPAEIERLEAGATAGSPGDRLKLAYLLSRTECPTPDPDRAGALLEGLAPAFHDRGAREIAHLLGRTIILEQQLRAAQHQTAELRQKIEQLKGLERELDDSSRTTEPVPAPSAGPRPARETPAGASH